MANKALICLIMLFLPLFLFADINAVLDEIYTQEEAPLLDSAWLILVGAEQLNENTDPSEAQFILDEHNFTGDTLTRGQLALLLMESYSIPQGLMYRLTRLQRYALKDLIYLNVLSGKAHMDKGVTGFELVNAISTVVEEKKQ